MFPVHEVDKIKIIGLFIAVAVVLVTGFYFESEEKKKQNSTPSIRDLLATSDIWSENEWHHFCNSKSPQKQAYLLAKWAVEDHLEKGSNPKIIWPETPKTIKIVAINKICLFEFDSHVDVSYFGNPPLRKKFEVIIRSDYPSDEFKQTVPIFK